ncbi:hypothetical protein AOQ84DRAFT_228394 [Glonium stellatum]|uniref:Uncharacterized protein n=1 Tax=Glonium stellatum TaxID=574774 RepID=A0A8E2JWB5_9PEZI|nr:hypothetical protein AOQ84DRAFT_228394 [Glonium stellatum]
MSFPIREGAEKLFISVNSANFASNQSLKLSFSLDGRTMGYGIDKVPQLPPEILVYSLMHPPKNAFVAGILSLNWAVTAVGRSHFTLRAADERPILSKGSELRLNGQNLGIPGCYYEWLCGDDLDYTESEDGFMLTPDFFKSYQ